MNFLPSQPNAQGQRAPASNAQGVWAPVPVSERFIDSAVRVFGLYNAQGLARERREVFAAVHRGFRSSQEAGREAQAFAQLGAQKNVGHERYHGARA